MYLLFNPMLVLDEDDNNTVSTLDEYNNSKHVRKIGDENNEPPTQLRKLKKKPNFK